jgi:hypothetical protein
MSLFGVTLLQCLCALCCGAKCYQLKEEDNAGTLHRALFDSIKAQSLTFFSQLLPCAVYLQVPYLPRSNLIITCVECRQMEEARPPARTRTLVSRFENKFKPSVPFPYFDSPNNPQSTTTKKLPSLEINQNGRPKRIRNLEGERRPKWYHP